jgi:hypothetical protein
MVYAMSLVVRVGHSLTSFNKPFQGSRMTTRPSVAQQIRDYLNYVEPPLDLVIACRQRWNGSRKPVAQVALTLSSVPLHDRLEDEAGNDNQHVVYAA